MSKPMTDQERFNMIGYIGLGLVALFALYGVIQAEWVKRDGRYIIARKTGITKGGKNAASSNYRYYYGNKKYEWSIRDGGSGAELIYLQALPTDPTEAIKADAEVPACMYGRQLPTNGWATLPTDSCK